MLLTTGRKRLRCMESVTDASGVPVSGPLESGSPDPRVGCGVSVALVRWWFLGRALPPPRFCVAVGGTMYLCRCR
jgi:hypothetical protein